MVPARSGGQARRGDSAFLQTLRPQHTDTHAQISWCYILYPWNSEQRPPTISMSYEGWMQAGMLYVALHSQESRSPQDLSNETKL